MILQRERSDICICHTTGSECMASFLKRYCKGTLTYYKLFHPLLRRTIFWACPFVICECSNNVQTVFHQMCFCSVKSKTFLRALTEMFFFQSESFYTKNFFGGQIFGTSCQKLGTICMPTFWPLGAKFLARAAKVLATWCQVVGTKCQTFRV